MHPTKRRQHKAFDYIVEVRSSSEYEFSSLNRSLLHGDVCRERHDITDEEACVLSGLGLDALKRPSTIHRVGSVAKRVAKVLSTPVTGCYSNVKVSRLSRQRTQLGCSSAMRRVCTLAEICFLTPKACPSLYVDACTGMSSYNAASHGYEFYTPVGFL